MCNQKPPTVEKRNTTESGVVWYDDTPEGHAAQAADEAAAVGPGSAEPAHPEPADPPEEQKPPSED